MISDSFAWNIRTELLIGGKNLENLLSKHVLIVGVGGVGAYIAEMLARAGIGEMTLIDADTVSLTNKNRQLIALDSNLGKPKVEVMAARLRDINPEIRLHLVEEFLRDARTVEILEAAHYDYVADAIDSLSPKVFLIYHTLQKGYPLISAMGAGGKLDPDLIQCKDIKKTNYCRLAHAIRKRLHRMGIRSGFKAVFSPEEVCEDAVIIESSPETNKLSTVGTISYMPAMFGCRMAAEILKDLRG